MATENKHKTATLILGEARIDWLTLTSYDDGFYLGCQSMLNRILGRGWKDEKTETTIQQYSGYERSVPSRGWAFLGSGVQKDKSHAMLRVSGDLSHHIFMEDYVAQQVLTETSRVTRLDIQITVPESRGWSQWDLNLRLRDAGKRPDYKTSFDRPSMRELATVYLGSRHSMRFKRIYLKVTTSLDICVRFEVELKKARAHQTARAVLSGKADAGDYLAHEIKQVGDDMLTQLFSDLNYDLAKTERIVNASPLDGTWEWLVGVCVPVIDRYMNQHDNERSDQLRDLLEKLLHRKDYENDRQNI